MTPGPLSLRAEDLLQFLRQRRWFGEKQRAISAVTLTDVIPVRWPGADDEYAVARARVTTDAGVSTYQLFLKNPERSAEIDDALDDPAFRRGLADAFRKGTECSAGGVRWIVEPQGARHVLVPPGAPVTLSHGEHSNSALILNREAILKLFRRIEPGRHPDVEVTRFLTVDRGFPNVPVLLGTIRFEDADGTTTVAGMLQEYVQGAVDGWTYVTDLLKGPDADRFAADAKQLGAITRALHDALASGDPESDFAVRPVRLEDVQRWGDTAVASIEHSCARLRTNAAAQRGVADRQADYVARVRQLARDIGADGGAVTRTHGDYHLGQVLRSASGQFLVVDFEGEPTRPLHERRRHRSPLRDVAGMLRSFSYVALSATGSEPPAEDSARWESRIRAAFLEGYLESGVSSVLPHSLDNARRLIALFEMEKLFYEMSYELDHRPDWLWIPLRAAAEILERAPGADT